MAGGTLSEGDESEEENVEKLQGIIRFFSFRFLGGFLFFLPSLISYIVRSHSFRLRTLHEEDVFSVGKVSLS